MSDDKKYPSHRISFSEIRTDQYGEEKLGKPVEIASVWPRSNGKKGGLIEWHIDPKNLGEGVYYHFENERGQQREEHAKGQGKDQEKDAFAQTENRKRERDDRGSGRER